MTTTLAENESKGDSVSLVKIDGKSFTPIGIEDSNYTEQGKEDQEGIKITTKESFDIDGEEINKFHTTRKAVVSKLKSLRAVVNSGELGAVKCVKTQFGNGKSGFKLEDA